MEKYLMVPPGFEPDSTSSDSEPEPNQYIVKPSVAITKPSPQPGLKIEPQELPSEDEDSDEPGTEPDSESEGSDPKLNPMVGMPAAGKKRAADGKAKKAKNDPDQFNRFFGEEDEIVLLNGMVRFAETNKSSPLANLDAFRKFVLADLKVDPTTEQLKHKIYKFKSKYTRNLRKEKSGNARRLKAHERRAYELSKLVWANEYIKCQKLPSGQKAGDKRAKAEKNVDLAASGGGPSNSAAAEAEMAIVSLDDVSVNRTNVPRIGAQTGKEVEGDSEWVELMKAEMGLYLKKVELMRTKTSLTLDELKSKDC